MINKLLESLDKLPTLDLLRLKKKLDPLIKEKLQDDLGRRRCVRARVKIPGFTEIEREKDITDRSYKITILNMSVNGMCFTTTALIFETDILGVTFRLPSTGAIKYRDCEAVRVREVLGRAGLVYEVGVQAVSKEIVRNYREALQSGSS